MAVCVPLFNPTDSPQHGQAPGTGRTARVALWGLPTSETCARYAPVPGGQVVRHPQRGTACLSQVVHLRCAEH